MRKLLEEAEGLSKDWILIILTDGDGDGVLASACSLSRSEQGEGICIGGDISSNTK